VSDPPSPIESRPATPASHLVTHYSHRYFLPVAGTCAVVLAALILLGEWSGTGPALYWTLFAVGVGALVSSFGFLAWQESLALRASRPVAHVAPPAAPVAPAVPGTTAEPHRPVSAHHLTLPHLHSGLGRAAVSAAFRSGDDMWRRWVTPASPSLGVEVAGPVASSWYSPTKEGALAPFAPRDQGIWFLSPDHHLVIPDLPSSGGGPSFSVSGGSRDLRLEPEPTERTQPFTEFELDTLFPPEPGAPLPPYDDTPPPEPAPDPFAGPPGSPAPSPPTIPTLSDTEERPRAPSAPSTFRTGAPPIWEGLDAEIALAAAEAGAMGSGPSGMLPTLDSLDHQVYLEALNPTPPHLRTSHRPSRPKPPKRTVRSVASPEGHEFCTMCARKVADFRTWVECPRCGRPLCRDCLGISFLTGAGGRCFNCRESREPVAA
jgi:hypothetical protein